ncbi:MAG: hypothetical protein CL987_07335 [Euryarchaeota archaeon]|nr:hypothetical protein [Euryarchaeota archaeon]
MESRRDRFWLLGEPRWRNSGEIAPDFLPGELSPPADWVSTTPRIGSYGWCRQRMRPLAHSLLIPLAWAPFFLLIAAIPLAIPGRTPNDQGISTALFTVAWSLVIIPILFSRNSQPMSGSSFFSLPVDWASLTFALSIFPLHILVDSRLGWISYFFCWLAYFRTIRLVQIAIITPPARFLLPIDPIDWEAELESPWEILSVKWSNKELASADFPNGKLVLSGFSRTGQDFLSLAFVHRTGFVKDPFHESMSGEIGLADLLSKPLPLVGREWPARFLQVSEEE